MTDQQLIEQIKSISGIIDLSKLTPTDSEKLLQLIGEQRLKEAHVKALVDVAPNFLECAMDSLKVIGKTAEGAGESQQAALAPLVKAVDNLSRVLELLASHAESDDARLKIADKLIEAGRLYLEFASISERINKDNNNFWLRLGGLAGAVVLTILAAFAGGGGRGPDSKA